METGFNFGRNTFVNHSSPFDRASHLWVIYPANKGITTNIIINFTILKNIIIKFKKYFNLLYFCLSMHILTKNKWLD